MSALTRRLTSGPLKDGLAINARDLVVQTKRLVPDRRCLKRAESALAENGPPTSGVDVNRPFATSAEAAAWVGRDC
jgi:hypothetical protein